MVKTYEELAIGDVIIGSGSVAFWIVTAFETKDAVIVGKRSTALMLDDNGKPCLSDWGSASCYMNTESTFTIVLNLCDYPRYDNTGMVSAYLGEQDPPCV